MPKPYKPFTSAEAQVARDWMSDDPTRTVADARDFIAGYRAARDTFRGVLMIMARCPGAFTTDQVTGETYSATIKKALRS